MTGMNEQDRIRADKLEHLRQDIRDGLDSGPATPWSSDEAKQEGRQRRAERRQRDRQVLKLEDFTEEDLKAILALAGGAARRRWVRERVAGVGRIDLEGLALGPQLPATCIMDAIRLRAGSDAAG